MALLLNKLVDEDDSIEAFYGAFYLQKSCYPLRLLREGANREVVIFNIK